eukprot:scaffold6870_cov121-Cylindrotheca_fusiformis.AAC.14
MSSETITQKSEMFRGEDATVSRWAASGRLVNPSFEDDMWVTSFDENGDFLEVSFEASPVHSISASNKNKNFLGALAGKRSRHHHDDDPESGKAKRKEIKKRISKIASRVTTTLKDRTNHISAASGNKRDASQQQARSLSKKFLRRIDKDEKRRKQHPNTSATAAPTAPKNTSQESKPMKTAYAVDSAKKESIRHIDASDTSGALVAQSSDTSETISSELSDMGESKLTQTLYRDQQILLNWDDEIRVQPRETHKNGKSVTPQKTKRLEEQPLPTVETTTPEPLPERKGNGSTQKMPCTESELNTASSEELSSTEELVNTTTLYKDQQVLSSNWGRDEKTIYSNSTSVERHNRSPSELEATHVGTRRLSLVLFDEKADNRRSIIDRESKTLTFVTPTKEHKLMSPPIRRASERGMSNSKKKFNYRTSRKSTREDKKSGEATRKTRAVYLRNLVRKTPNTRWLAISVFLLLVASILSPYLS